MEITLLGLFLGLLLLSVPLGVAHVLGLRVGGKAVVAAVRMVLGVGLLGAAVWFLDSQGSVALSVLFVLLMILFSVFAVVRRSRVGLRNYFVPVFAGVASSSLIVAAYVLLAVLDVECVLGARYLIPVVGVLSAGSIVACSGALSAYHSGLRNHSRLYYYLIGNGATHAEALDHFLRRAMEKAMLPGVSRMAVTVVASAPVMMWGMVVAGVDVFTAAAFQVVMTVAMFASSVLSVLVTLVVARRYTIDKYSRLNLSGEAGVGGEED